MVSLETTIAGIPIERCIWNAAGAHCITQKDLEDLGQSRAGAILSKSCTFEPRVGNPEPRYYEQEDPFMTINSTGLANLGYKFYGDISSHLKETYQKPYFVSVSGLSQNDNLVIVNHLQGKVDAIELNLSCPNIVGKPQIGYDFEGSDELLRKVFEQEGQQTPLGLKLPPYFDQVHIGQMCDVIKNYPIGFVTCCNSLGNCLIIDSETESVVIKPKHGLGGIGGTAIKPVSLANVFQFNRGLPNSIDVIGCGGVRTGTDVFEHILAGASAVQIGSQLVYEGVECFQRIENELMSLMNTKNYDKITIFKGKLNPL